MRLKIYGCKGSIPYFNRNSITHGGNTSCVRLDADGHIVIIDCGSGILSFADEFKDTVPFDILLTHLHFDHIIGLSMFQPLFNPQNKVRIFTKSRISSMTLKQQVFGVFKPPYWPIELENYMHAEMIEINNHTVKLNENISVTPFDAFHPDQTTSFIIETKEERVKRAAYLLDYEVESYDELAGRLKGVDVIIFDSCYLPEHYPDKIKWGHSTYEMGVKLAKEAGCKKLILSHFSHEYSDEILSGVQKKVEGERDVECIVAYDGYECII